LHRKRLVLEATDGPGSRASMTVAIDDHRVAAQKVRTRFGR